MRVVHARCGGLDVHKRTVVACVLQTAEDGTVRRHVRTFGTMAGELLALSDWLARLAVGHIPLESTGVYWRPVFNLLEGEGRELVLVNPQHIKHVPGHKTDVQDAEWLADLLRHGLLRGSFIPPAPVHPHLLRHARVRQIVRQTKSLPLAQKQAGWSRLQMAYLTIGDDEARELMRRVED
jgi:transposase